MKHLVKGRKLGRRSEHKRAMLKNMATSLFKYEKIKTTIAKAKELRSYAEKMITRAKVDSLANKRVIMRDIKDLDIVKKLFTEIGPRYKERPGGYTRIIRLPLLRRGDASQMVLIELVEQFAEEEKK